MSTKKNQPLTFSEYRIANGIWLQQELRKEKMHWSCHTDFYYNLYLDYIRTCGLHDLTEHLKYLKFNHRYSQFIPSFEEVIEVEKTIYKNIILEIDMIVTTYNLKY